MEANYLYNESGIMTPGQYINLTRKDRGQTLRILRRGCKNTTALVAFDSLPARYRDAISEKMEGNPYHIIKKDPPASQIEKDYAAFEFFTNFRYPDGSPISTKTVDNIALWGNCASVLNKVKTDWLNHAEARAAKGKKPLTSEFYRNALKSILDESVKRTFPHNLPENTRRLQDKLEAYIQTGYTSLIKGYKGNQNARKVSASLENLILSLYSMPNKPYSLTVHDLYRQFLAGKITVVDKTTGEIFDRAGFYRNGKAIQISEATVWQYINNPKNRVWVDKARNDSKYFNDTHRPHHHRYSPQFSLSKISLDDRDIPNSDAKAYYAFDLMSGCVIGKAYSKDKTTQLFTDCLNDMFRFLTLKGLGTPLECEVENHLVNQLADTLMKEGGLFKYVRWCNPGNSQEKWAENGIRLKKLGAEKLYQQYIGRFYSKLEANRPPQVGEWDANGMRIKEHKRPYDKAVADDLFSIEKYNNSPHPDFEGKTRLQVLIENPNPRLPEIDNAVLALYIGDLTKTSIRRSQYVIVQHEKYGLPSPGVLAKLKPNNYNVSAYYLPTENGVIDSLFLYQDGSLICECRKLQRYNTARAEQIDTDREAYIEQAKYVNQFDAAAKNGKNSLKKLVVLAPQPPEGGEEEKVEVVKFSLNQDLPDEPDFDYGNKAVNDF